MSQLDHGIGRRVGAGFSLIELMVAIAVMAILAMIAVPNFSATIHRHQLEARVESLRAALVYARTEAILRQYSVSICPSSDGASCLASATDYSQGWLVYTSPGAAGQVYASSSSSGSSGMTLLRTVPAESHVALLASRAGPLSFGPLGQLSAGQTVNIIGCASNGTSSAGQNSHRVPGRQITLSAQGGVALQALAGSASCSAPASSG